MSGMKAHSQFLRFAIVGCVSNAVLFLMYLALTTLGMGHKVAMSALYLVGIMQTFVFNKRWSFKYKGAVPTALFRYWIVYASGYLLNLSVLMILVDHLGFPHQMVQGIMILVLAVLIFLAHKFWVFRTT